MLTGTSCRFSVRFCAVTTTSCKAPEDVSGASAAYRRGTAAMMAAAIGARRSNIGPNARCVGPPAFFNLRSRLRCMRSPLDLCCRRKVGRGNQFSKFGRLRISIQHGAQSGLKWPEPGFKLSPLLHARPVDGRTHLLGARGPHRTLILIEPQTSGFVGQATIGEQST